MPLLAACALSVPGAARAQFANRSQESGVGWTGSTWGASLNDLDLDGDLDLYTGHHFEQPVLFWNDGTGTFDTTTHPQPWAGAIDRHGALFVSIDTDRDLEVFVTHGGGGGAASEANELYRNDGGGAMISLLGAAGMGDPPGRGRAASAADYNLDGRVDIYVAKAPDATSFNSLYRNDLNFFLSDVAASVGLNENLGTGGGIFGDYDNDGDPDLLVGGEEFERPTKLFRNDGAAGFTDATATALPPGVPVISGADWGDYDNDGDLDLALCTGNVGLFDVAFPGDSVSFYFNTRYADDGVDGLRITTPADTVWATLEIRGMSDPSLIFLGLNELHPSSATNFPITSQHFGVPPYTPGVSRGIYIWRTANAVQVRCSTPDLNLDTFDGFFTASVPLPNIATFNLEDPGFGPGEPLVYRNDGGVFVDVSGSILPSYAFVNPRQVSWVDYNNDGRLDLHVIDKGNSAQPNPTDKLYRNTGTNFADVTLFERLRGTSIGLADGGVWGDVDGDGDLDLYLMEGEGPAYYSDGGTSNLFLNEGNRGPSIQLDLVGRDSGRHGVGTRVRMVVNGTSIYRTVEANSWRGFQDPLRVHLGLGGAAAADSLILEWTSGAVDSYGPVPAGFYTLTEGEPPTDAPLGGAGSVGEGFGLGLPLPQPARGTQTFVITSERPTGLDVTIHDVAGRVVRHLHDGPVAAGATSLAWDGRDDHGATVASGVYFVVASDGRRELVRKSVRTR